MLCKKKEIMNRIKASLEFKYNKPEDTLTRETILKIYNKVLQNKKIFLETYL